MTDPQQELFSALLVGCRDKLKYDTYDGELPPDGTPYPFVYLGEVDFFDDYGYKAQIAGRAAVTIHVYSDDVRKRGTLSQMLMNLKALCWSLTSTDTYAWSITACTQRILPDNTTDTPLLHGVIEAEFKLLGGKTS